MRSTLLVLALATFLPACSFRLEPRRDPFYDAVLALDPDHPPALLATGELLFDQGRFADARDVFGRATRQRPESVTAWSGLGYCQLELQDFSAAENAFRRAWALQPTATALAGCAQAVLFQGRTDEAEALIEDFGARHGRNARYWRLRGDVAFVGRDPAAAQDHYQRSLQLDPAQTDLAARYETLSRLYPAP